MRREEQASALPLEPLGDRCDLLARWLLLGQEVVESQHHEGVRVGQDAFVDRKLVAGLVDTLEDRHRMRGRFLWHCWRIQGGPVERFQCPRDAVQKTRRVVLRCLVGRPCDPSSPVATTESRKPKWSWA